METKELLNNISLNLYNKAFNKLNVYELEDLAIKTNTI